MYVVSGMSQLMACWQDGYFATYSTSYLNILVRWELCNANWGNDGLPAQAYVPVPENSSLRCSFVLQAAYITQAIVKPQFNIRKYG